MTVPPSLRSGDLSPLWEQIRARLEAHGTDNRGRLKLPALPSPARLALQALIDRAPGKTVDLAALEAGLVRLGIGDDLAGGLAVLGYPVSDQPAQRRAKRAERQETRRAVRAIARTWPESWAPKWIDSVIRAGVLRDFDTGQARTLLHQVRSVLDYLEHDHPAPISRVDLAAQVLGSAHALDTGTRVEAAVTRALGFSLGAASGRDLWARAGVHFDLTSAPVLTWRLPMTNDCRLEPLVAAARHAGIPLHLSRFALEKHPASVPRGSAILVVENPRVVEAAAQSRTSTPIVSTNGQPSSAVLLLLTQLREAGAELRYHGDFDAAGLAICERLTRLGLRPWRMDVADYRHALATADAEGAVLPTDANAAGPTSWDPNLQHVFDRERRIVHQERLLPILIG